MDFLKKNYGRLEGIKKIGDSIKLLLYGAVLCTTLVSVGCKHDPEDCANNPQLCLATCINDPTFCVDTDEDAKNTNGEEIEKESDSTAAVAKLSEQVEAK